MTNLKDIFELQRQKSRAESPPNYETRKARLDLLIQLVEENESEICNTLNQDFGNRCETESILGDIIMMLGALKENRRHLKKWMSPKWAKTALQYFPANSRIESQPLGVVGIIAPWNYPFQLALIPVAQAIAAGNRVMLKPSELAPNSATLLEKLLNENFAPDQLSVITGDSNVGKEFASLPFDHLFFTGSTEVGRMVVKAAAENLTPITLELGGKSPAIFGKTTNYKTMIPRLAFGKCFNGGQTCIAPDYAFVPREDVDEFVKIFIETVTDFYPNAKGGQDYTSIINENHYDRLKGLIGDAQEKGAKVIEMDIGGISERQIQPTIIKNATDDMAVMKNEIFGPILPIIPYETIEEVINYINDKPRPLSLYYFGEDKEEQRQILDRTVSGGVTINDVIWHIAQESLPFGGVGASGSGAYHGEYGFKTFSKEKPVFIQSRFSVLFLLFPPYGKLGKTIIKFVKKIL